MSAEYEAACEVRDSIAQLDQTLSAIAVAVEQQISGRELLTGLMVAALCHGACNLDITIQEIHRAAELADEILRVANQVRTKAKKPSADPESGVNLDEIDGL